VARSGGTGSRGRARVHSVTDETTLFTTACFTGRACARGVARLRPGGFIRLMKPGFYDSKIHRSRGCHAGAVRGPWVPRAGLIARVRWFLRPVKPNFYDSKLHRSSAGAAMRPRVPRAGFIARVQLVYTTDEARFLRRVGGWRHGGSWGTGPMRGYALWLGLSLALGYIYIPMCYFTPYV